MERVSYSYTEMMSEVGSPIKTFTFVTMYHYTGIGISERLLEQVKLVSAHLYTQLPDISIVQGYIMTEAVKELIICTSVRTFLGIIICYHEAHSSIFLYFGTL